MNDKDFAQWLRIASSQPVPVKFRFAGMLLACRCAGISTTDMRYLRGNDVRRRRDGAVSIAVPGPAAREAIVLDRYADQFLAATRAFRDDLIVGTWPHRENPTSDLVDAVRGGQNLPRPMPRTLRMAYVVEMLQTPGVEVITLRAQLGGTSLSEIESALPFASGAVFGITALRRGATDGPQQTA